MTQETITKDKTKKKKKKYGKFSEKNNDKKLAHIEKDEKRSRGEIIIVYKTKKD